MGPPRVNISTHAMWRIRLSRELPRYVLGALSVLGLAASARFAIAPPRPIQVVGAADKTASADRAAEGYATLFARRYLTWNAADPLASARDLQPFLGAGVETGAGLALPPEGTQRVEWAEVVQAREPALGEHVYTVAAQTDAEGLVYLTVGVTRLRQGGLTLSGYPAFVGPPLTIPAQQPARLSAVNEPALEVVVRRALANYLSGSSVELAADLAPDTRVSLPSVGLSVQDMGRLMWAPGGGSVIAQVQAGDRRGVRYTLAYEVDVTRAQGRWEISAVQMDPTA